MYEIRRTERFSNWLDRLRDAKVRARILARLDRVAGGSFGDSQPLGESVSEFRIHYGPGYRVCYTIRHRTIVVLLVGGIKSTQERDIRRAIEMARRLEE